MRDASRQHAGCRTSRRRRGLIGVRQINMLKAQNELQDANAAYAATLQEGHREIPGGLTRNPGFHRHFSLANSYDNLYKPAKKGRPRTTQPSESRRVLQEGLRDDFGAEAQKAVVPVIWWLVRHRQA